MALVMDRGVLDDAGTAGLSVSETSTARWLTADEIVQMLTPQPDDGKPSYLQISSSPAASPRSGSLLLFDSSATPHYASDGHGWVERKTKDGLVEDNPEITSTGSGQRKVEGRYCRSKHNQTMHRREYRLIDPPPGSEHWVLVQYLDTLVATKVSSVVADHLVAAAVKDAPSTTDTTSQGSFVSGPRAPVFANSVKASASKLMPTAKQATNDAMEEESAAAPPTKHVRRSSKTMEILWDMVMEGGEGGADNIDDMMQEAAATAIDQHMTPMIENQLANTVEEALEGVAKDILIHPDDLDDITDDDLAAAVDQVLSEDEKKNANEGKDQVVEALADRIPSQLEEKLVSTMEKVLANEDLPLAGSLPPQTAVSSELTKDLAPEEMPLTPLTEVIDITPQSAVMNSPRSTYAVVSSSAPLPLLPPDDLPYRWQILAALVGITGQGASGTWQEPNKISLDPKIMRVALSPLRKLTPYSYKFKVPADVTSSGLRSVILLAVRILEGSDPISDALEVAVKVCIQAEWSVASDLNKGHKVVGSVNRVSQQWSQPTFLAPAGGRNIQLLTQLSQEQFMFYVESPKVSPFRTVTVQMEADESESVSRTSQGASTSIIVATPAMASVANALIEFPVEPPTQALSAKVGSELKDALSKAKSRKRTLTVDEVPDAVQYANEVADGWMSSQVQNTDVTVAQSMDRHCKIRFVERLAAGVIVATDDNEDATTADEGVSAKDQLLKLNEDQTDNMDINQLDQLLDSVLIHFVESLLASSASEDELKEQLNTPGFSGFTLLHYATLYGFQALVPILLTHGADLDTTTVKGKLSPLHLAAGAGHQQIVSLLVRNGCTVNARDSFGMTPADHALRGGFVSVAQWLYEKCGDTHPELAESQVTGTGDERELLLQSAFQELNLKEKLGLNLFAQGCGDTGQRDGQTMDAEGSEDELALSTHSSRSDIPQEATRFSFISDTDKQNLKVAMSLMSKKEREELERNAPAADVRKWMLRSNYESLKEATAQLEKEQKRMNLAKISDSASGGVGKNVEGKKLSKDQLSQALAMLVMRKNLLQVDKVEDAK